MSIDFNQLTHEGIRSLVPYLPGTSITQVVKEKGLSDVIKMASNENPLGCSPLALSALSEISSQTMATYPIANQHHLITKLAKSLGIESNQLLLGNGSDALFTLLLTCFALHRKKHMLTHCYAFSAYAIQAKALGIPVQLIELSSNWQLQSDQLIEACTDETAIIFLANPNNPTGILTSAAEIGNLLNHIPASTLLVLDEAYFEFAAPAYRHNSLSWLANHPNLIITRTFSKIYGMAALRLGYLIAHPDLISLIQRVQLPFAVNHLALTAAYAAIDDTQFIKSSLETNAKGKHQLEAGLNELQINFLPSAANFITFDCQENGMTLYNVLLDHGIIVRPLHAYHMDNWIRVSIGTSEQNQRFLNVLTDYYRR